MIPARAIFAGAALVAAQAPGPATAQNCAQPVTQLAMNDCARAAWEQSDAVLNQLWGIVKPQADAEGAAQDLLTAQRAWLAYRDATCGFERSRFEGGSIAPLVYWNCMQRVTLQRNDDLRGILQ